MEFFTGVWDGLKPPACVVQDNPSGRGPVGWWSQLWPFFPCPHSNSCLAFQEVQFVSPVQSSLILLLNERNPATDEALLGKQPDWQADQHSRTKFLEPGNVTGSVCWMNGITARSLCHEAGSRSRPDLTYLPH